MALINRISKLFRADMHAVIDKIEEPGAMLKLAVHDMEKAIEIEEQQLQQLQLEQQQAIKQRKENDTAYSHINEELDICFAEGDERLSKSTIKRKLENRQFDKLLNQKTSDLENRIDGAKKLLQEHHARLISLKQKMDILVTETSPTQDVQYDISPNVSDDDVEIAFLREKQQRTTS